MTITLTPASGAPYALAEASDIVTGIEVSDEAAVETVRLFRRATGEQRPRGGALTTWSGTIERVHASHDAALGYALDLRRALTDAAARAPLTVAFASGATAWTFTAASVATGPTRTLGIRTLQPVRITGALA